MANFFQPGNAKTTQTATPSPAAQARTKFDADILGKLLEYASQPRPSFSQFAQGASFPAALPGGLSAGIPGLLAAYNQPGAFTAQKTGELQPPSTSMASDIAQALGLAGLVYNSPVLAKILQGVGGMLHIPELGSPDSNAGVSTDGGFSAPLSSDQSILDALGGVSSNPVPYADAGNASDNLLSAILGYSYY